MAEVDKVITSKLSTGVPLVGQVCRYIISAGGKRLRPALMLMMSGALGYTHQHQHTLAAVVEFIHTATLLHDDVVDESTLRRGRDTANELFGNAASVLVGDFLYSRAFQMMVEVGEMRVMEILAEATNVIAEGEVMQLMNMRDASLDKAGYLTVIRSKTAKLFEASARLAPIMAKAPVEVEAACAAYGQALGTAFQIIDDVLDYEGDASLLGKNLGDDLREGKVTLPVIHALENTDGTDRDVLINAIEHASDHNLEQVLALVRRTGGVAAARTAAEAEAHVAVNAALQLPESAHRTALIELALSLQNRET
ncbi:MAG: polyprenyl synthetase family protein [Burkholderiales bacterium]|nr:polyprenyl synthetase family protein [Burkholderiales bacterium]